ncbi:hypothetical protein BDF20DRAFT_912596 [Mycotypha africana]|uniref:uncharacterized protein n=1 Tax=Mycotypha africana TaxID=64632 RepID=UPI0023000653|nr:uncharacterized protein BDF20DRAFT_912596 [Mycotypha africana]KAI8982437.1 hypothetical protein BDF20DRAFT_912596 [Mycotypha africana]
MEFYAFESACFNFDSYQGKQRADAEVANILLDGGKKYNKRNRAHTNKNKQRKRRKKKGKKKTNKSKVGKRKREKREQQQQKQEPKKKKNSLKLTEKVSGSLKGFMKTKNRCHLSYLVMYTWEDAVIMRGRTTGITSILYKELLKRQRTFLTAVVDIDEYRTSKICNNCKSDDMEDVRMQEGSRLYSTKAIWTGQERFSHYNRDSRTEDGAVSSSQQTA